MDETKGKEIKNRDDGVMVMMVSNYYLTPLVHKVQNNCRTIAK